MDIPYASSPQGIKYFTIIGPHIDCMDERYLVSLCWHARRIHAKLFLYGPAHSKKGKLIISKEDLFI